MKNIIILIFGLITFTAFSQQVVTTKFTLDCDVKNVWTINNAVACSGVSSVKVNGYLDPAVTTTSIDALALSALPTTTFIFASVEYTGYYLEIIGTDCNKFAGVALSNCAGSDTDINNLIDARLAETEFCYNLDDIVGAVSTDGTIGGTGTANDPLTNDKAAASLTVNNVTGKLQITLFDGMILQCDMRNAPSYVDKATADADVNLLVGGIYRLDADDVLYVKE